MAIVGPGTIVETKAKAGSQLDGASEFEYVTVRNPLTDDFVVRVAQDIPVNMPFEIRDKTSMVQSEGDITRNYGLGLKNPDFQGRKHITNDTVIPAGQTYNFKGPEAQVAVRQIVNELMQREGNARLLSDPELRAEAEKKVIVARGSIQDLMDERLQSPSSQLNAAVAASNEQPTDEAFPQLKKVGRPKKIVE